LPIKTELLVTATKKEETKKKGKKYSKKRKNSHKENTHTRHTHTNLTLTSSSYLGCWPTYRVQRRWSYPLAIVRNGKVHGGRNRDNSKAVNNAVRLKVVAPNVVHAQGLSHARELVQLARKGVRVRVAVCDESL